MEISLGTPALLFPAISLLMLAYTNRFLALTSLIRQLGEEYKADHEKHILEQIAALRFRVRLILWMQFGGIASLALCVAAMLGVLFKLETLAIGLFAASLVLMLVSLVLSLLEIRVSTNALSLALQNLEQQK
jgi:Zn-dependent membrane protease YugP